MGGFIVVSIDGNWLHTSVPHIIYALTLPWDISKGSVYHSELILDALDFAGKTTLKYSTSAVTNSSFPHDDVIITKEETTTSDNTFSIFFIVLLRRYAAAAPGSVALTRTKYNASMISF